VILNNFNTRLGHRVGRMLGSLFHQIPNFKGRRVVTFHNQRDFIFFRHHRYVFESKEKARLQQLGPKFTLKLRWMQHGVFDTQHGEMEWLHKASHNGSRYTRAGRCRRRAACVLRRLKRMHLLAHWFMVLTLSFISLSTSVALSPLPPSCRRRWNSSLLACALASLCMAHLHTYAHTSQILFRTTLCRSRPSRSENTRALGWIACVRLLSTLLCDSMSVSDSEKEIRYSLYRA
jgi:hypothetical protein